MTVRAFRHLRALCVAVPLALVAAMLAALATPSAASPAPAAAGTDAVASVFSTIGRLRLTGDRVRVAPTRFSSVLLDRAQARRSLATAPSATEAADGAARLRFAVPTPDGGSEIFAVVEDSVMEPGLAKLHPELHSYAGRSVSDPTRTVRLDLTPMGFHASVRDLGGHRAWYVDPAYNQRGATEHVSYYAADLAPNDLGFEERDVNASAASIAADTQAEAAAGELVTQRVYRMAFVTEPSYAAYFGGGENVLAEKLTVVNRASHIYNDDLAIKFVLVEGSDDLNLDTLAKATGPDGPCGANGCFTADELESCGGDVLDRNKFVTGQIVGADKFDVGHFGSGAGSGGVAYLGVVGGADKAGGCTALDTPDGDFYAIDFFAHEVGHQMGGNHTFNGTNGSCAGINRNGPTSVEPGSGSSVQAYAGICFNDDLQPHTDPYFSQRSIDEITAVATATPGLLSEEQVVNLTGLDTGDTFQLTYADATPVTITQGVNYNALGLQAAVLALTGKAATVSGYDGASSLGPEGFTVDFADTTDMQRLGLGTVTGGVAGFVGVIQNGGPETNGGGSTSLTANHAPTVVAPVDKTLPVRTPFTLTGSGSDVDGDALTYLWEQNDAGFNPLVGDLLGSNSRVDGPLFRVFGTYADVSPEDTLEYESPGQNHADGNPSRTFPDLAQVVAGTTNAATGVCPAPTTLPIEAMEGTTLDCYSEFLPTAAYALFSGEMNFRLTGRDGFVAGGGTSYDDVTLTLDPAAGPFLVSSRASAGTPAEARGTEVVEWDVAGTDAAELAPQVRISLSTDGGRTFPFVLAESTPNDGAESVTLPGVSTTEARIKVEAVDNYFFDVNDADFTIVGTLDVTEAADGATQYSDPLTGVGVDASSTAVDGDTLEASVSGVPGLTVTRTAASEDGVRPGTATFAVTGGVDAAPGVHQAVLEVREPGDDGIVEQQAITVTVTAEDAAVDYTGDLSAASSTSTVPVTFASSVTDADDGSPGDVTGATVAFVDRDGGGVLCSAPVTGGPVVGSAECTVDLPTGSGTTTYDVGTVVSGSHVRDDAADDVELTVTRRAAPVTTITGGVGQNSFVVGSRAVVRYASSSPGSTFDCRLDGRVLGCGSAQATLRNLQPGMHRFSVAARDAQGVSDPTPVRRLFSVPLSARVLDRTRDWTGATDGRAYRGFAVSTRTKGAVLRYDVRRATRVALVVGTGPGFGRVRVFFEGKRVAQLSLASGRRTYQVLLPVERFSRPKDGTLRIVTLDGKPVRIEGLGVFVR